MINRKWNQYSDPGGCIKIRLHDLIKPMMKLIRLMGPRSKRLTRSSQLCLLQKKKLDLEDLPCPRGFIDFDPRFIQGLSKDKPHHAPLGPERAQADHPRVRHRQRTRLRTMRLWVVVLHCLRNRLSKKTLLTQLTNQIIRKLNSK